MYDTCYMILVSGELSNLVRMRNSAIGKSAPSLSVHVVSISRLMTDDITYLYILGNNIYFSSVISTFLVVLLKRLIVNLSSQPHHLPYHVAIHLCQVCNFYTLNYLYFQELVFHQI